LRDVVRFARRNGFSVRYVRRTGEGRISHPEARHIGPVTFNARRKDAPRAVTQYIRRVLLARRVDARSVAFAPRPPPSPPGP
jgi:hypothetical protein